MQLRNEAVALVLVDDAPPDNLVKIANMNIYEESAGTLRRLSLYIHCFLQNISCKIFPAVFAQVNKPQVFSHHDISTSNVLNYSMVYRIV